MKGEDTEPTSEGTAVEDESAPVMIVAEEEPPSALAAAVAGALEVDEEDEEVDDEAPPASMIGEDDDEIEEDVTGCGIVDAGSGDGVANVAAGVKRGSPSTMKAGVEGKEIVKGENG